MIAKICPRCKKHKLRHMHDTAHGIAETHMDGSERFECQCGFRIRTAKEAERYGLKFVLDTE